MSHVSCPLYSLFLSAFQCQINKIVNYMHISQLNISQNKQIENEEKKCIIIIRYFFHRYGPFSSSFVRILVSIVLISKFQKIIDLVCCFFFSSLCAASGLQLPATRASFIWTQLTLIIIELRIWFADGAMSSMSYELRDIECECLENENYRNQCSNDGERKSKSEKDNKWWNNNGNETFWRFSNYEFWYIRKCKL